MKTSELLSVLAIALQCALAILIMRQCVTCLQVSIQPQQQQQDSTAVMAIQHPQSPNKQQMSLPGDQQVSTKPNHRLVSKLKDARYRRWHRHLRHRHHHPLGEKASATMMDPPSSSSLTALESIVEEVARAGHLPTSSSQQSGQREHLLQHVLQTNPVVSGSDLLLDGSSSPVTMLQQAPSQPIPSAPPVSSLQSSRGPVHNSRGFFLTSMLSKIMNVLNVTEFALEMRDGISSRASCMACNAVVGLFLSPLYSKDVFSAAIRTVCTSFKIQSPRVCIGLVESFQDDLEYIRKNTKMTRDEICAVVFGVDCARRQTFNLFWTVPIPEMSSKPLDSNSNHLNLPMNEQALTNIDDAPDLFEYRKSNVAAASGMPLASGASSKHSTVSPKPVVEQPKQELNAAASSRLKTTDLPNSKSGQLVSKRPEYIFDEDQQNSNNMNERTLNNNNKISTFVHITDIHIDPYYEAGTLNDCNEPLCCRATSGLVNPADKRRQSGRWGDYGNCDTPVRTLRNALNRIREQHSNAEYWLWTGDISPHDIWNISKSESANNVRMVTKLMREYSNGLPVFPVIGNHEAHPVNSFSPPEIKGRFSMSWLYDLLADEWSDWLPKEALKTLRIGGFYKLQVRKGFRIIALNTNYCARLNIWSFYDPVDPANQLKWLVDELLEAELNQDRVHIIGHVPPDNRECTQAWLFNFINIVDRFKDIIEAQFYGHTHRDEFRIIYSMKKQEEPIGIQYIGPSITPFTENNPAYRIYRQDKSGHLIDFETFYFNLTEANETPTSQPNWQFSYNTATHLNMTQGLTPSEWHQYLQRIHDDDEKFNLFYKNFYRSSDAKSGQVCRAKCKYQMISDLRLSHPYKTKPKPFLANRKTSNHHHHKRHRHSE